MKYKFFIFLFAFFAFIALASASIVINEIMPHTNNSWGDEWIELYNPLDNELNLSGWKIGDKNSNDTITNLIIHSQSFALIVDSNASNNTGCAAFNISNESCIEFPDIGKGLNDDNESVFLYDNSGFLNDSFSWTTNIKSSGRSWGRNDSGWTICIPTPGAQNNCSQQQQEKSLELSYPSQVQCNENFTIAIKASNFDPGIYDVKVDIRDVITDNRVAKVWNGTKWISTAYYVNDVLTVNENGTGQAALVFRIEAFSGEAYLKPTIRGVGTFDQDYSISATCSNQSTQTESKITIINAPTSAKFGDEIEIELEVYKGDTAKYAVYVYVEDANGTKVSDKINLHFDKKFTNYDRTVTLTLKCKNEHGTYKIIAEGLGTSDEKEIALTECDENESRREQEGEGITIGDFTYTLTIPNTIYLNQEFQVKIKITNNGDEDKNFRVWSYVYRASKCYSCEDDNREANVKTIEVKSNSFSEMVLENIVSEESGATSGDYKLKIKVLQEDLKTPKEFTYNISLIAPEDDETQTTQQTQSAQSSPSFYSQYSSRVIESESFSLVKVTPYILSSLLLVLVIYLIIKKI